MTDLKVLIVDDYEMFRMQLRRGLAQMGFEKVEEATDGVMALAKLADAHATQDPFRLVLLDINMPKKNGFEVLEECRADARFAQLPIVMISAEAEPEYVKHAHRTGANGYIVKPLDVVQLKQKLGELATRFQWGKE